VLVLVLAVTGCATPGPAGGSAIDRANANFVPTVATGTVVGAGLGAIAGALLGGRNGAAFGALAGGALGTGAGFLVAHNNQAQAQNETTLEGQIAAAQLRVNEANEAAAEARQAADQAQAQSRALMNQYRAGKISATEYQTQLSSSASTGKSIQQLLGKMQTEETRLRQQIAAAGTNAGPLQQSLGQLEASRRSLQGSLNEITAATSAVPQA
jgi:chromosome segregation ATPase